jgi:hypothetical protein
MGFDLELDSMNTLYKKVLGILTTFFLLQTIHLQAQNSTANNPLGYQDKWNVNITPFLLLPKVNGEIESKFLSSDYGIGTADFVSTLNGTFMVNAEAWNGDFFITPSYIYNHNEIDKTLWTSPGENLSFKVNPVYKRHIAELIGGWRLDLNNVLFFDPYIGFRYTHYEISGNYSTNLQSQDFSETAQYWDPLLGLKIHYYPHPRIPIELRGDIGGFGLGSDFTWSTFINTGYSVAPWLDCMLGFAALGNSYYDTNVFGDEVALESITYGFDFGLRFFITKRERFQ